MIPAFIFYNKLVKDFHEYRKYFLSATVNGQSSFDNPTMRFLQSILLVTTNSLMIQSFFFLFFFQPVHSAASRSEAPFKHGIKVY